MTIKTGAQLFVENLISLGVEVIFGIPGAKIDALFNALKDSPIKVIVCRHEQNAVFMAQAFGKLTQKPGVVLVTSGPGVSNLVTGLLTATTEGDPVVAIGGNVERSMRYKKSHQSSDNVAITKGATKLSVEIIDVNTISEICQTAFREATAPRSGAVFISIPQDILMEKTDKSALKIQSSPVLNGAPIGFIEKACEKIKNAKSCIFLLGQEASKKENTQAIRNFLKHTPIACTATFQGAGVISKELKSLFVGRVGLFKNQPGDLLLDKSDVIIAVGFSTVEYDPEIWNKNGKNKTLIHIDYIPSDIHEDYIPNLELIGNIATTLEIMGSMLKSKLKNDAYAISSSYHESLIHTIKQGTSHTSMPLHPLRFIHDLQEVIDDETLVISDIGSHYMWMARYFLSFQPRHFLVSNGQQTLGVALPWAIASRLIYPNTVDKRKI